MRLGGCHYNMSQNAFAFYENMHYLITACNFVENAFQIYSEYVFKISIVRTLSFKSIWI